MRWLALLLSGAWLVEPALAVFADDAFQIDHHVPLLGLPQSHTTFFHQPYAKSKASLLYTLSDKAVLGAINPRDGAIVWRQALAGPANSSNIFLRAGDGQDVVVSGVNNNIAAWAASDGRLIWSRNLGNALVHDLEIIELPDAKGNGDVLILYNDGHPVVQRLDGGSGNVKWEYIDKTGDNAFQVSTSSAHVYLISFHKAIMSGLKIRVTSLDQLTGRETDAQSLSSESDVTSPEQILYVGANSASPLIAWTDKANKALKVNILGTKTIVNLPINNSDEDDSPAITLHAPHRSTALTHFLVHYQSARSHWADVYHVNLAKSTISKAYSLPKLAGQGAFSCSTVDANVFFTRVTESEMILVSSASHGVLGRWPLAKTQSPLLPLRVTAEVAALSSSSYPTRAAVLSSNGEWTLLRNGDVSWTRPEYLTGVITATFVDLPEEQGLVHELELEGHQNALAAYVHRLTRHVNDLKALPSWLQSLPKTFMGSKSGIADSPQKDKFGFRKYIILALEDGRIAALDTTNPTSVLWSKRVLKLGPGERWSAPPELRASSRKPGIVEVWDKAAGRPIELEVETGIEAELPDSPVLGEHQGFTFELADNTIHAFSPSGHSNGAVSSSTWKFMVRTGDRIVGVAARPVNDPVASIGKVLGDRRVLYKYLDPNIALVSSVNDATGSLTVHLLDTVSGTTLHSVSYLGVDTTRTIASTVAENWFAYSFTLDDSASGSSRGHQIVISEMYESPVPNDRGPLGDASNYSSLGIDGGSQPVVPHVISQTFHIPEEIQYMTVTRTRQGITSRELLVTLADSHGIVAIPRQLLDARRPVGRDPTADEVAEGLVRYHPTLEFDPKWYLNHQREVLGVKEAITSPSNLESTSLVFAYGLDIFGTRVAPSFTFDVLGKGFNKLQMLATVAALGVGVIVVAPLVRRKQINQRWQISS
ncbi:DUF1620-domain-containing protein [Rhizodiscina lignyota]|uniref:ER membrane protein complex subunit 1 n=1 Tax=Rhizodiscina lignyota TaxID=1504668 RepID=A0A9P4INB0_9PEZI|nr:DUF1620-domain-containing protein [Rhizodiscina lignyota]